MNIDDLNAALSDRYRIERELGRGGMAVVYLAHDWNLGRDVALKVLLPELAASLGGQRFLREIEIAAKLSHPNILSLHDRGEVDGLLYYTMPYVDGESLRDRLDREKQLPMDEALRIASQVAEALHHAHQQGVVHRDIKPENILLQGEHALVADFGIARAVTEAGGEKLTQTGIAVGTVTYMAPEQSAAGKDVDARSDLYSLGCVLYEMIGGEPPFTGPSAQAIMARHALDPPPSVSTIRPATPPGVEEVILRALAKNAVDRYKTAEHMRVVLSDPEIAVVKLRGRLSRLMRTRPARAVVGVAAMTAVAFGVWQVLPIDNPVVNPSAGVVAVLPFYVDDDLEKPLDQLSITNLLRTHLSSIERYRVILDEDVRQAVARLCPPGRIERFCGSQVAMELGAQYHVTGEVTRVRRDSVQIVAYMTDVMGGRSIPPVSLRGSLSEAYDLIRRVFQQLATATAGEGEDVVANAAFSTESPAAMTALMNGELYLGQGLMDSATMAFQRAVEADSNYALAWYRLTLLHDWNGNTIGAAAAAAQAEENADQLSAHDRRLLQGFRAHIVGDVPTAEAIYQDLLEQDPDDFEALMQLGYLYWGHNWRFGRTMAEAVEPLRRANRVKPHTGASVYLAWALMAGSAEDPSMLDEVDSIVRMHNWTGFELAIAGIRAMRLGDSIGVAAAMDSIGGFGWCTDDAQCFLPFMGMIAVPQFMRTGMVFGGVPNLAMFVPLIETLVDSVFLHDYIEEYVRVNGASPDWRRASGDTPSDVSRFRRIGYSQLADLSAGQGRWGAVRGTMRTLADMGDETSVVKMAMMATLPIPGPISADADSLRRDLMEWDVAGQSDGRLGPQATILEVGHQVRLYLLGLLSAREGDFQAARDYADQVEALEPVDVMPTIHLDLAAGVRADVLLREGRPGEALAVLEAAPRKENNWAGFGITGERELFLRGRALWELGRYQEAVPWYTINGLHPASLSLLAPSHYYKGQIYEDMGDTERARWHYAAFVELWRNADPEYQPFVEEALGRMAQLGE